ncbi:glycosyltransferase family 2 protein [Halolamina rubra]|uniref:glycosyltransferase family 2 protein n=1 Tax=Halolamina rubra TaxID=1380430 RepID=UPI000A9C2D10|nr:glycosyltransferase family 2 protein [Halolamina rubra]
MAQTNHRAVDGDRTDRPVICVTTQTETESLVETVVDAQDAGYPVLVVKTEGDDSPIVDVVSRLGVSVTTLPDRDSERELFEELIPHLRDQGYPGAVFHDTGSPLDLEASVKRLESSDQYAIRSHEDEEYGIIVGIPAYNEEIGIGSVVHASKKYADKVIVVDDGSSDTTVSIAESAGAEVIEHETNRGKGGAVQTLFDRVERESFKTLVLIDGDGQHLPQEIPQVAEQVVDGNADMVVGSRYLDQEEYDETPMYRRFGQQVLDKLTLGSSGADMTDTQSGFRAFSPQAVRELELKTDGIGVETEMIDSAAQQGLGIEEVPIHVRYDGIDGQTYHPLRHGLTVVKFVLELVRDRHPLVFFGVPGLVLTLAGALYGIDGILIYRATGNFYPAKALVSGFVTIIGVLGIFSGLILNRISNTLRQLHE